MLISIKFPFIMSMLLTVRNMNLKGIPARSMSKHNDRELLEELEALGEIIEWLEHREHCDLRQASESLVVDEHEVEQWLRAPSLARARSWLKQ